MVKPLNWTMGQPLGLMVACCICMAGNGSAETLPDPTRPPAALTAPAAQSDDSVSQTGRHVLESVIVSRQRRLAIIGGQTVGVGDRLGEARVVRISESEVVLRGPSGTETLKMFQGIEKKFARPPLPGTANRQHSERK